MVHIRLLHHVEELARIGRERLDIAPLALGIDRVEGERGLAGSRQPGDDDEPFAGEVERGLREVVFCSMEMAGDRPSIWSTSGFCIMSRNWRA
jgi:hypothetical protein